MDADAANGNGNVNGKRLTKMSSKQNALMSASST